MADKMLAVLEANGATDVMVVYGHDGLDELSISAPSTILHSKFVDGAYVRSETELDARSLGFSLAPPEELRGGDADFNAARAHALLGGETGAQRDFLLLNAAAALQIAGHAESLRDGIALAAESIDTGAALNALARLISASRQAAELQLT
jgi:anthranilate phosphoribosyltransferase